MSVDKEQVASDISAILDAYWHPGFENGRYSLAINHRFSISSLWPNIDIAQLKDSLKDSFVVPNKDGVINHYLLSKFSKYGDA